MTIFDSSGIEAFVHENNPKYSDRIIRQLKAYAKAMNFDESYDPYKAAYDSMPSHSSANPEIKKLYINGHFCYVFKFGIVTNGLGIIRHISFYNKDFLDSHPESVTNKKSDSPDEDKSVHDARLLIPTLKDFFRKYPLITPETFLGDADGIPCCPKDPALPMNGHPTLHPIEIAISGSGISEISFEYCSFSISMPYISFIIRTAS